jgi:hypothetical protein
MNLHAIAGPVVNAVTPPIAGLILRSAGYNTDPAGKQIPKYLAAQSTEMRVQALSGKDLDHTNFLNLQGTLRAVYLYGDTQGVIRPLIKGGDLLQFAEFPGQPVSNWLVTLVLETWAAGWSKVIVTLQNDSAL